MDIIKKNEQKLISKQCLILTHRIVEFCNISGSGKKNKTKNIDSSRLLKFIIKSNRKRQILFHSYLPKTCLEDTSHKELGQKELSPNNQALLKVLKKMYNETDDMGEEWWNDFFKDLDKYRFKM